MDDEITLDLRELFYALRKRRKLILLITITCTLISGILSFFVIKPTYEAKTSIVIGKTDNGKNNDKSQYDFNDVMMFQKLVKTYAEIGKSRAVAENASARVKNFTADQIQKMITVTPQTDTQIVEFKIQNNDPREAFIILNAVSEAFIQESKRIYPSGNIQVMDNAKTPEKPIKPNKALNVAIAFFIGLMASVGLVFVLEYMDNTIKTEEDVSRYLDLPVIGIIPKSMEQ